MASTLFPSGVTWTETLQRVAGAARGKPVAWLGSALLWPVRVARARREFARLAELSEHELRDIGLTRQDLRDATALPLGQDPTRHLAAVAAERTERTRRRRPA